MVCPHGAPTHSPETPHAGSPFLNDLPERHFKCGTKKKKKNPLLVAQPLSFEYPESKARKECFASNTQAGLGYGDQGRRDTKWVHFNEAGEMLGGPGSLGWSESPWSHHRWATSATLGTALYLSPSRFPDLKTKSLVRDL